MTTQMAPVVLVCAPAGSGFREAMERLTTLLKKQCGDAAVAVADVEDVLCSGSSVAEALKGRMVTGLRITMREVTWNLTRDRVTRLWRSALADAVAHLHQAREAKLRVLACHLNLYGGKRKESYSPLDVSRLKEAEISHLLLLIDDIFDMYARLTTRGHLYDEEDGLRRYLQSSWEEEGGEGTPKFSEDIERDLSLEWRVRVLTSLLAWRHAEMILAESLASQLGAHYMVFGTKQIAEVATRWLQDPIGDSAYLSHPISRPRRTRRSTGSWPPVVTEFNRLQQALLDEGVASIMPTAIDEFRLTLGARRDSDELSPRLSILDPRWPSPSADLRETLYSSPTQDAPEYTYRLMPQEFAREDHWNVQLRFLESQIKAEIPFRDHHLVVCNRNIVIYRPCYQAGYFSEGVEAEVKHWADLRELESNSKRRAVFIHFEEDLKAVLDRLEASGIHDSLVSQQLVAILVNRGLAEPNARNMASAILTGSGAGLLDEGADLAQVQGEKEELLKRAHVEALGNELTAKQVTNTGVALWLVDDANQLFEKISEIARFLSGERERPSDWEAKSLQQLRIRGTVV